MESRTGQSVKRKQLIGCQKADLEQSVWRRHRRPGSVPSLDLGLCRTRRVFPETQETQFQNKGRKKQNVKINNMKLWKNKS